MYTLLATVWVLLTSLPLINALRDPANQGPPQALRRIDAFWGSNRLMVAMMSLLLDAALAVRA